MQFFAIRNKKTGRLLIAEPEHEQGDDSIYSHLELRDSQYEPHIYVTTKRETAEEIIQTGKCTYPTVRVNKGYGTNRFELTDLEIVELKIS